MIKSETVSPLMREFSRYIAGALKRKLPAEVAERARIHCVDTFGAMVSGSRLLPGQRAIAYVKPLSGLRDSGVIGTRTATSALYAALANGMCAHADETDDTHPPTRSHPGASIVPAVLAMSERQQLSGKLMLRAMVLGYDIGIRVLLALKETQLVKSGHHAGSKGGLFGSAAAASALLKLDDKQIRHVLSYCAQQSAGLFTQRRDTEHIEKAYTGAGMPAHSGVAAALMVAGGFSGVGDVFSGEPNFISIFSPDADREALTRGLGREYEILRGGIKYWPAGGPIQAPLHMLSDLLREHRFAAGDVEKLVVKMAAKDLFRVDNREMPDTTVQHLLAVMLIDGAINFVSAHDYARMKDRRVLALRRDRIFAIGDPAYAVAVRGWRCGIEVTLKDGRTLAAQTMAAKGSHENPLSRSEIAEKALDLMGPVLGTARSRKLIAALFDIEHIEDVRSLRRLYAG